MIRQSQIAGEHPPPNIDVTPPQRATPALSYALGDPANVTTVGGYQSQRGLKASLGAIPPHITIPLVVLLVTGLAQLAVQVLPVLCN